MRPIGSRLCCFLRILLVCDDGNIVSALFVPVVDFFLAAVSDLGHLS